MAVPDPMWQVCSVRSSPVKYVPNQGVSEVAFVGKAPGSYVMLLGGGYYGQRLNKIYRGRALSLSLVVLISSIVFRIGDGAGDFGYSRAHDSTLRAGAPRWGTFWRFRDQGWIHFTSDQREKLVRWHGRRRRTQRNFCLSPLPSIASFRLLDILTYFSVCCRIANHRLPRGKRPE
jgi:hypothetical protein